jgi:NTE family protein
MSETTSTAYGFEAYLPRPREQRSGIALCLSGGGYRAALFHLGALRRLNELGVLSRVDTITSVSGGSITAAQLASHLASTPDGWPDAGKPLATWEDGVARPLRAFTRTNIRTRSILTALHPKNWFDQNAAIEALAERYAAGPAPGVLAGLPKRPRFVICASDMRFRTQWVFDTAGRIGGDGAGHGPPIPYWTLARAVAASSCVPGAFRAMRVRAGLDGLKEGGYRGTDRDELVESIDLADGGVYDNLGLEPVWRDHAVVLVSDAAPSLTPNPGLGSVWPSLRYAVTLLEQATDVRKRWLISSFIRNDLDGTFWSVNSRPSHYEFDPSRYEPPLAVYSDRLIAEHISQVRIDLDAFSDGEIGVLENHGYLMVEIAIKRHAPELVADDAPEPRIPHKEWMDEERAARALADSAKTRFFSRRLRL